MAGELVEGLGSLFDSVGDGVDDIGGDEGGEGEGEGEGEGDKTEEEKEQEQKEKEEFEKETDKVKESVSGLKKIAESLKSIDVPQALKSFVSFVVQTAASAAIFYAVSLLLNKLSGKQKVDVRRGKTTKSTPDYAKKEKKIAALAKLFHDETTIVKKLLKWLKEHENDTVEVAKGITVPISDIFYKYTKNIKGASDKLGEVSKKLVLKEKGKGKKTTFAIPTLEQVDDIISDIRIIHKSLDDFLKYAQKEQDKFPVLKSLSLTDDDIKKIGNDLKSLEKLPY